MKKSILKSVLASSITLSITLSSTAFASPIVTPDAPQIAAKGYVLMDYHSGKVLAEKRDGYQTLSCQPNQDDDQLRDRSRSKAWQHLAK